MKNTKLGFIVESLGKSSKGAKLTQRLVLVYIEWYFSNENIMADIPILEIDCNMEFHDDEQIKVGMLQQVDSLLHSLPGRVVNA